MALSFTQQIFTDLGPDPGAWGYRNNYNRN